MFGLRQTKAAPWAQAISRGALIDVTAAAAEYSFRGPVGITSIAWAEAVAWDRDERRLPSPRQERQPPQAERLRNVLAGALRVMRQAQATGTMWHAQHYEITVVTASGRPQRKRVGLKMLVHPGDAGEAVGTIMLAEEEPAWLDISRLRSGRTMHLR